jgi:hypothetical protein
MPAAFFADTFEVKGIDACLLAQPYGGGLIFDQIGRQWPLDGSAPSQQFNGG